MARLLTARNLFILILVLAVSVMSVFVLRFYRGWGPATSFESIPENVDLVLNNIEYSKNRDGKLLWTLVADKAAHSMHEGITRIENIQMVFFDPDLGDIILTADQGEIIPQNKTVKVRSNVKVANIAGNEMHTEYLEYTEATNSLQTDKVVRMKFDNFSVSGTGMKMDVEKRMIFLLSNVKALLAE